MCCYYAKFAKQKGIVTTHSLLYNDDRQEIYDTLGVSVHAESLGPSH
mgnify:CR=1 FL=1